MVSVSDNDGLPHWAHADSSAGSSAFAITDILLILRRAWRLPLCGCLIGLIAASAYVISKPPAYKSAARLLIDRSVNRFLEANKILDAPAFDDTGSQIYVLSSESIVLPVVRSMDLAHDRELGGNFSYGTQNSWGIGKFKEFLKRLVGLEVEPPLEPEAALERIAVENFMKHLNVSREDVPGVITVTFESVDAKKAARIANAIADSYVEATADAKSNSTKLAIQLIQDRLMELRQAVRGADEALKEFKAANNLISKGDGPLPTDQIAGLTQLLTSTRMKLAEAKAKLQRVQEQTSKEEASGNIFPDNQVIVQLRSKYVELTRRADELASTVGADHAVVVKLRKEMDGTRADMRAEEKRAADSYVNTYQSVQTQGDELSAMMAQLLEDANSRSQAQITMRELEARAESLHGLYNSVLQQSNQLKVHPANRIQDATIISRAAPQLHRSSDKSLAVLGGGFVFGLLFGAGGAVAREYAAGVFRTSEQVKQAIGIYCVSVPRVEAGENSPDQFQRDSYTGSISTRAVEASGRQTASSQNSTNSVLLEEYVLDAPHSRFTESFRHIKALVQAAHRAYGDKVIGVVSPVMSNGKSTTVINLATLIAASSAVRTLVIDADLHRRQLTASLHPEAREGLIEVLDDPSRLATLIVKRPRSGADFLPCALSKRVPNAAELLGSPEMERLLIAARNSYDYIIVECPPIMSVVDVKMMERFVDRFVFVIEWGQTKRRAVREALDEIDITRERTLCFVLNKVDPKALRINEAYKGRWYTAYYEA